MILLSNNFSAEYSQGMKYFRQSNFTEARKKFNISINDPNYKNSSFLRLIQIEIKEGKYSIARQMLDANKDEYKSISKDLYGLLESVEYNYEASKKYYDELMMNPDTQYLSLLKIAQLHMQTGDYDAAKLIIKSLRLMPQYYTRATFNLIFLAMIKHDYLEAQKLLSEIDLNTLSIKLKSQYKTMNIYISYCLGKFNTLDERCYNETHYILSRLKHLDNDDILLNHIERHKRHDFTTGYFFESLDFKLLLEEVRNRIKNMNASHFEISDMYKFKLDRPIGCIGGIITNDICATTIIGTENIITLYPVLLSDEFDKEGNCTSKELKLKRLQGGIKK